jgi:hypothetical protein
MVISASYPPIRSWTARDRHVSIHARKQLRGKKKSREPQTRAAQNQKTTWTAGGRWRKTGGAGGTRAPRHGGYGIALVYVDRERHKR